jgi:hypothetical protein
LAKKGNGNRIVSKIVNLPDVLEVRRDVPQMQVVSKGLRATVALFIQTSPACIDEFPLPWA